MLYRQISYSVGVAIAAALWPLNSAQSQIAAVQAPEAHTPEAQATGSQNSGSQNSGSQALEADPADSVPCVLLKNDNVLFGQAYQVGEYVVVRTGEGGEVQLRRSNVACWATSTRDLYRYRVDHRRKGDLAAHVHDARWCLRYDLFDLVTEEIRAIRAIDPQNSEARAIEDHLKRLIAPVAPATWNSAAAVVQPVGYQDAPHNPDRQSGHFDPATLRTFASHVQPMLLNRCGRCHQQDAEHKTQWKLAVPRFGTRASSQMTHANLAASLTYVDRRTISESELLVQATTPHGGGPAPLDARNAKAIESLKAWLALASNSITTAETSDESPAPVHEASPDGDGPTPQAQSPAPETEPRVAKRQSLTSDGAQPPGGPARLPQVANPFDPDLFNRRFHPDSIGSE